SLVSIALSPNGTRLAFAGRGAFRIMDGTSGEFLTDSIQDPETANCLMLQYTPNGRYIVGSDYYSCTVWDASSGARVSHFEVAAKQSRIGEGIRHILFTRDGKECITLARNYGTMRTRGLNPTFLQRWELGTGRQLYSIALPAASLLVNGMALSNDEKTIALS